MTLNAMQAWVSVHGLRPTTFVVSLCLFVVRLQSAVLTGISEHTEEYNRQKNAEISGKFSCDVPATDVSQALVSVWY